MIGHGDKIKLIPRLPLVNKEKMNYVLISSVKIISRKIQKISVIIDFSWITIFPKLKRFLKCKKSFGRIGYLYFNIRIPNYILMLLGFSYHVYFSKTKDLIPYLLRTKLEELLVVRPFKSCLLIISSCKH